jgi:hypothetical protein
MRRIHPVTGEVFVPHRYSDGKFKLVEPGLGRGRNKTENAVLVGSETEAAAYVRRGYALRMRSLSTNVVNLIGAKSIVF